MQHDFRQIWIAPHISGYKCKVCNFETHDLEKIKYICPGNRDKYWYYTKFNECVLGDECYSYKERRYYEKPKLYMERCELNLYLCSNHYEFERF